MMTEKSADEAAAKKLLCMRKQFCQMRAQLNLGHGVCVGLIDNRPS